MRFVDANRPLSPAARLARLTAPFYLPSLILSCFSLTVSAVDAWGQAFEAEPTLSASDELAPERASGPHHRIEDSVTNDGYMNTYRILSDYGEFVAYGNAMLQIRLREIEALAELDELSKSKVFLDATAEAALRQVDTVKTIAEKPVETIKGVPGGVGRMFKRTKRKVERGIDTAKDLAKDDDKGEGSDSEGEGDGEETDLLDEGVEAGEKYAKKYFGVSRSQRKWAEKLGVDPYTSNEVLVREIKKVAKVDAAGSFTVRLAPVPTIPGVSYLEDVSKLVWSTDPYELRERNVKLLTEAGASQELIDELFGNPWFSPSSQTYLLAMFSALEGVEGREVAVRQAAAAESEEEAMFFLQAMRMLVGFHGSQGLVERLLPGARLPGAKTADGRLAFMIPVDYISWTEGIAAAAEGPFRQAATGKGVTSREVWFRGGASPRCREELTARGWKVFDRAELTGGQ